MNAYSATDICTTAGLPRLAVVFFLLLLVSTASGAVYNSSDWGWFPNPEDMPGWYTDNDSQDVVIYIDQEFKSSSGGTYAIVRVNNTRPIEEHCHFTVFMEGFAGHSVPKFWEWDNHVFDYIIGYENCTWIEKTNSTDGYWWDCDTIWGTIERNVWEETNKLDWGDDLAGWENKGSTKAMTLDPTEYKYFLMEYEFPFVFPPGWDARTFEFKVMGVCDYGTSLLDPHYSGSEDLTTHTYYDAAKDPGHPSIGFGPFDETQNAFWDNIVGNATLTNSTAKDTDHSPEGQSDTLLASYGQCMGFVPYRDGILSDFSLPIIHVGGTPTWYLSFFPRDNMLGSAVLANITSTDSSIGGEWFSYEPNFVVHAGVEYVACMDTHEGINTLGWRFGINDSYPIGNGWHCDNVDSVPSACVEYPGNLDVHFRSNSTVFNTSAYGERVQSLEIDAIGVFITDVEINTTYWNATATNEHYELYVSSDNGTNWDDLTMYNATSFHLTNPGTSLMWMALLFSDNNTFSSKIDQLDIGYDTGKLEFLVVPNATAGNLTGNIYSDDTLNCTFTADSSMNTDGVSPNPINASVLWYVMWQNGTVEQPERFNTTNMTINNGSFWNVSVAPTASDIKRTEKWTCVVQLEQQKNETDMAAWTNSSQITIDGKELTIGPPVAGGVDSQNFNVTVTNTTNIRTIMNTTWNGTVVTSDTAPGLCVFENTNTSNMTMSYDSGTELWYANLNLTTGGTIINGSAFCHDDDVFTYTSLFPQVIAIAEVTPNITHTLALVNETTTLTAVPVNMTLFVTNPYAEDMDINDTITDFPLGLEDFNFTTLRGATNHTIEGGGGVVLAYHDSNTTGDFEINVTEYGFGHSMYIGDNTQEVTFDTNATYLIYNLTWGLPLRSVFFSNFQFFVCSNGVICDSHLAVHWANHTVHNATYENYTGAGTDQYTIFNILMESPVMLAYSYDDFTPGPPPAPVGGTSSGPTVFKCPPGWGWNIILDACVRGGLEFTPDIINETGQRGTTQTVEVTVKNVGENNVSVRFSPSRSGVMVTPKEFDLDEDEVKTFTVRSIIPLTAENFTAHFDVYQDEVYTMSYGIEYDVIEGDSLIEWLAHFSGIGIEPIAWLVGLLHSQDFIGVKMGTIIILGLVFAAAWLWDKQKPKWTYALLLIALFILILMGGRV